MVTVTVVSDLHLEARPLNLDEVLHPDLQSDVLCLLGDIGDPALPAYRDFLAAVAQRFPTVILLAGNNEYRNHHHHHGHHHHRATKHQVNTPAAGRDSANTLSTHSGSGANSGGGGGSSGRTMGQTEDLIRAAAAAHPNLHFLQNTTYVTGGVAFIGSTLWSYLPDDPLPPPKQEPDCGVAASGMATKNSGAATSAHMDGSAGQPQKTAEGDAGKATSVITALPNMSSAAAAHGVPNRPRGTPPRQPQSRKAKAATSGSNNNSDTVPTGTVSVPPPSPSPRAEPRWDRRSLPIYLAYNDRISPPQITRGLASEASAPVGGNEPGSGACPGPCAKRTAIQPFLTTSTPPALYPRFGTAAAVAAAASARCCRRPRQLQRSVSLSTLPPDETCPPWCTHEGALLLRAAENSSGGSSSSSHRGSESDARSRGDDASASEDDDSDVGGILGGEEPSTPSLGGGTYLGNDTEQNAEALATVAAARTRGRIPAVLPALPPSGPAVLPAEATSLASVFSTAVATAQSIARGPLPPDLPPRQKPHTHLHQRQSQPAPQGLSSAAAAAAQPAAAALPATIREFIAATSLDYRRIFATPSGEPITPDVTNALFAQSLSYIAAAVAAARARGLVPVVLSHHAPSMRGTSRPAFAGHPSTHAYSSDLESYMASLDVAVWYCGHTHHNFDLKLQSGVHLASNQFGSQPQPIPGYSRTWQHSLSSKLLLVRQSGGGQGQGRKQEKGQKVAVGAGVAEEGTSASGEAAARRPGSGLLRALRRATFA